MNHLLKGKVERFIEELKKHDETIVGAFIGGSTIEREVAKWTDIDLRVFKEKDKNDVIYPIIFEGSLFDVSFHTMSEIEDIDKVMKHPKLSEIAIARIIYDPNDILTDIKERTYQNYNDQQYRVARARSFLPSIHKYHEALYEALQNGRNQAVRDHCGVWLHFISQCITMLGGVRPTMRSQMLRLREASSHLNCQQLYMDVENVVCPNEVTMTDIQYWKDKALDYYDGCIDSNSGQWSGMDTVIPEKRDYWNYGIQELIHKEEHAAAILAIQIVFNGLRPIYVTNEVNESEEFNNDWEEMWIWIGYPHSRAKKYFTRVEEISNSVINLIGKYEYPSVDRSFTNSGDEG